MDTVHKGENDEDDDDDDNDNNNKDATVMILRPIHCLKFQNC
jgi:hypothetical protein